MFAYQTGGGSDERQERSESGQTFGLLEILGGLWRYKWLVPLPAIALAGLAAYAATQLPDRYEATAQIFIDPRELRVLANEVTPGSLNSDATTAFIESQARIITSSDMLRRIVAQENLAADPEFVRPRGGLLAAFGIADGEDLRDPALVAAAGLGRQLIVRRGERTFVVDVTVFSNDPAKAARLSNAFAAAYLDDQASARADASRRASAGLAARLDELRERVRASEEAVEAYRREKNIVDAGGRLVGDEQLAAVNAQLALARARTADARAKLRQVDSVSGDVAGGNLPEAVNSPTLGLLRQQVGDADRRASTLATTLGDRHPEYLAALAVARDSRAAVAEEIGRIRAAARAEFERAESNEAALVAEVDRLKRESLATGVDEVRLRELQRELEANRTVYQAFLTRSIETGEQQNVDSTNARIITTATPPLERSGPQRRLMVMAAGVVGLGLGCALALGLQLWRMVRLRRRAAPAAVAMPAVAPQPAPPPREARPGATESAPRPANDAGPDAEAPMLIASQEAYGELLRVLRMVEDLEEALERRRARRTA
jgi:uncharacterized protein involved in exopolysaccharide biosynthesis